MNQLEKELKNYIKSKYHSLREFCLLNDFPYSTVTNMLTRGILGSSVSQVRKFCEKLNIDFDYLTEGKIVEKANVVKDLTEHEARVIISYRYHTDFQPIIDKILDIKNDSDE